MSKTMHPWKAGLLSLAMTVGVTQTTDAAVTVIAEETGGNVVFTSMGSLNLAGLTPPPPGIIVVEIAGINPTNPSMVLGGSGSPTDALQVDSYGGASIPQPFGTGNFSFGSEFSGPRWGTQRGRIVVPFGYQSGDPLNSSLVFNNATFASLGITPGTYVWSWDADNVTLKVVPVPAALPLLGTALAGLGFVSWRRRKAA